MVYTELDFFVLKAPRYSTVRPGRRHGRRKGHSTACRLVSAPSAEDRLHNTFGSRAFCTPCHPGSLGGGGGGIMSRICRISSLFLLLFFCVLLVVVVFLLCFLLLFFGFLCSSRS